MKIKGKPIADQILISLKHQIETTSIKPHLAIILATDASAPKTYVSLKLRRAADIGLKTTVYEFSPELSQKALETITSLNAQNDIHGILVQLPMYRTWNADQYVNIVTPAKDVDGFLPHSYFKPATGLAVWEMLKHFAHVESYHTVHDFLHGKTITVVGKGKTAGKPTIDILRSEGFEPNIIDSQTINPDQLLAQSDVIISAVGKRHLINGANIRSGSYVIGIGVSKELVNGESHLFGDIDEYSIEHKAKLYCPTIGGIGPLTIACLLRNVVISALK